MRSTGGAVVPFTHVDSAAGETAHRFPAIFPDGRTIVFTVLHGRAASRLAATGIDGKSHTVLELLGTSPLGMIEGSLVYANIDGQLLAVPFDVRNRRVTGVPIPVVDRVAISTSMSANAALSPTCTLIYGAGTDLRQLSLIDDRGVARPLVDSARTYLHPRFSPDGRRIAVNVLARGQTDVWVFDIASRTFDRVTNDSTGSNFPEWTPDGRGLLFASNTPGGRWLRRQSADGSGAAEDVLKDVAEASLTPDGRGIVYTSTSGRLGVRYRSHVDTTPKLVAADGGAARVSPDGRWNRLSLRGIGKVPDVRAAVPIGERALSGVCRWRTTRRSLSMRAALARESAYSVMGV